MGELAKTQTSALNKASRISDLIRVWLAKFVIHFGNVPNDGTHAAWEEALRGQEPEDVMLAMRHVEKAFAPTAACLFPPASFALRFIEERKAFRDADEAEIAWNFVHRWVMTWYDATLGFFKGAPELSPRAADALRFAGGCNHIFTCSEHDLLWAKKRFVEQYIKAAEYCRDGEYLNNVEAKKFLSQLREKAKEITA